nr:MAG TPA: hypothetical protein [Caudoviricetes sp.]
MIFFLLSLFPSILIDWLKLLLISIIFTIIIILLNDFLLIYIISKRGLLYKHYLSFFSSFFLPLSCLLTF